MGYVDPPTVAGTGALIVGILLVAAGLYARRGGRLRTRQGAQLSAAFAVAIGIGAMVAGALYLLSES